MIGDPITLLLPPDDAAAARADRSSGCGAANASSTSRRYGCDRHFRQRRTDSDHVAYVLTRGTALRGAREPAIDATDGPRAWSAADAPS